MGRGWRDGRPLVARITSSPRATQQTSWIISFLALQIPPLCPSVCPSIHPSPSPFFSAPSHLFFRFFFMFLFWVNAYRAASRWYQIFVSLRPSLPATLLLSIPPSPHFFSVCFQCQFCCVSVSQGSFWPTHGQTHSKPVQLISILHATFPALTKLCWVYVCVHVCEFVWFSFMLFSIQFLPSVHYLWQWSGDGDCIKWNEKKKRLLVAHFRRHSVQPIKGRRKKHQSACNFGIYIFTEFLLHIKIQEERNNKSL